MIIPFNAFRDYPDGLRHRIENALVEEYNQNQFILGPSVAKFEQAFARYLGCGEVVGVGNGYDALVLSLKAIKVDRGDEVVVPANGYIATINAVEQVGATPVLVEPDLKTYNMDAPSVTSALSSKTKVILPIHLYGQCCNLEGLLQICQKHNIALIEDFAQAHGARYKGRLAGTFGKINATSFYPTKNLSGIGDGGAVCTSNFDLAHWIRQYHNYGQASRYEYTHVGINSRLDSIQAAVLSIKLAVLDNLNNERKRLAAIYEHGLSGIDDLVLPYVSAGVEHVYHLYVVRTTRRNALQQFLQQKGIQTLIHYPVPPHLQPAYRHLGYRKGDFPITEELAETSLSLPLFPGLTEAEQQYVIAQLKSFFQ